MVQEFLKSTESLNSAIAELRKMHPLPSELASLYSELTDNLLANAQNLHRKLSKIPDNQSVIKYAWHLKTSELRLIFPALLLPESQNRRSQDRLFLLIRERACQTMYNSAWAVFQQNPDSSTLQKALSLLCGILEIKQQSSPELTVANLFRQSPAKALEDDRSENKSGYLPLISEIAQPDNRQFIKRLALAASYKRSDLQSFFLMYGINPNSALAANIISQSFIHQHHYTLTDIVLFKQVLEQSSVETQAELADSLLTAPEILPEVFHQYCLIIYQKFGNIDHNSPLWSRIRESARSEFRNWLIQATVGTHTRNSREKQRFYARYTDFINRVEQFSEDTLLVYFDGFVIADNRQDFDSAMYYGGSNASEHPFEIVDPEELDKDPASPATPHITCEEALRANDTDSTVILYLNQAQIKNSSAFIDFCLQNSRGTIQAIKRKIFG
ncbi:MAG: hypothetical protein PWP10_4463 [Clostridiales bacterium]|jgi:hypothetical protein|nr:hypothetical protein [Clostridiales bacterium]